VRRLLLGAVGALLVGATPAHAATFNVNTALDTASCDAIACSLRGALDAAVANGVAEEDVVNVPAGTYSVPAPGLSVTGVNARRITVIGAGANTTIVQPATASRVLSFSGQSPTAGQLTLRGLTIRGGRPATGAGGNITASNGVLTLEGVRVTDGRAAAGGGMSLAIAADLVVAAETAHFTVAYSAIGFSMDGGSSWTLPRIVGSRKAMELALLNERLSAARAQELGLVTRVVSDDALDAEAQALAEKLARGPIGAHGAIKRLLRLSSTAGFAQQLEDEAHTIAGLSAAPDGREGVLAFLDKRAPHFGEP